MSRTVAQKMGIKPGWTAHFVDAPDGVLESIGLPELEVLDTLEESSPGIDYIHLFAVTQEHMHTRFPGLARCLSSQGKMWLSWPKGRGLGSDLTLPTVIRIGYAYGLVESTCLRIDDVWSGLRFTKPIEGKIYQNRYGVLPSRQ